MWRDNGEEIEVKVFKYFGMWFERGMQYKAIYATATGEIAEGR